MKGWNQSDIDRLKQKGLKVEIFGGKTEISKKERTQKAAKVKQEPEGLRFIKQTLTLLKIPFEVEYRFHPTRKFRFDVAFPGNKVAIEYEGLVSEKSRHTTIEGYTNDCRKYNLAQGMGWRVLRYTAANYREFLNELSNFLTINQNT